jgi:hypothetical protein
LQPWPTMVRWTEFVAFVGGGKLSNPYDDKFFSWWEKHAPFIEDYPYAKIDFTGDPHVIIPPEDEPHDIYNLFLCYLIFIFIKYMYVHGKVNIPIFL